MFKIIINKLIDLKADFKISYYGSDISITTEDKITWCEEFIFLFNHILYEELDEDTYILWFGDMCFNNLSKERLEEIIEGWAL